jgi:peptidoglycan/LPS O-acetylase OafA/YrhL
MDGLLLGVMCAWLVRNEKYYDLIRQRIDWLYVMLTILFGGVIWLTLFQARVGWFEGYNSFEMALFGYSWISLFFTCFLLIVITARTSPLARMMRIAWLRRLGVISYCVYLIHAPVNEFVDHYVYGKDNTNINSFLDATAPFLSFAIVWLIASASWRFFEKPIITWGHSFLYRGGKVPVKVPENRDAAMNRQSKENSPEIST